VEELNEILTNQKLENLPFTPMQQLEFTGVTSVPDFCAGDGT